MRACDVKWPLWMSWEWEKCRRIASQVFPWRKSYSICWKPVFLVTVWSIEHNGKNFIPVFVQGHARLKKRTFQISYMKYQKDGKWTYRGLLSPVTCKTFQISYMKYQKDGKWTYRGLLSPVTCKKRTSGLVFTTDLQHSFYFTLFLLTTCTF